MMSKVELSEPSRQRRKSQVNHFSHYEYIDIFIVLFYCNIYEKKILSIYYLFLLHIFETIN